MRGHMLVVDPSITSSGVALFFNGRLITVATIKVKTSRKDIAARCFEMGSRIHEWVVDKQRAAPFTVVVEWPQVHTSGPNDRNDLLGLCGVNMAVISALAVFVAQHPQATFTIKSYLPREWARQLKKSKKNPMRSARAVYISSRLDVREMMLWHDLGHDAIDAIGIGLHHLGRMKPRKVFPGATN